MPQASHMSDLEKYYLPHLKGFMHEPVLDFGSGHGRIIKFLQEKGFKKITGFERDKALVESLESGIKSAITVGNDPGAFLEKSGEKYKAVLVKDVIYYFKKDEAQAFLRGLKDKMAERSILILEIFNGSCLFGPYVKYKDLDINEIYTEHSIQTLLLRSGFEIELVRGMSPAVTGFRSLAHYLASRVWMLKLRLFYWLERGVDAQNPSILEKKILVIARPGSAGRPGK
jgi:hypothetical protein